MLHLVFLGMLALAGVIWIIKIRAWELNVTVELPTVKKAQEDEASEPAPEKREP